MREHILASLGEGAVMHVHKFVAAVVPILFWSPAGADDAHEWRHLPPEWSDHVDYTAFCKSGDWSFLPFGEDLTRCESGTCAREEVTADRIFFRLRAGKYGAKWVENGPHADEFTRLRIARDEAGGITIQAYAGEVLAVSQAYPVKRVGGLFMTERPTQCEPGRSWRFLGAAWDYGEEYVSLALAADGSLLVHRGGEQRYLLPLPPIPLGKDEWRYYTRFPAASPRAQQATSAN